MTTSSETVPENSGRHWLGPFLRRLHFYAGILIGPFILVAALSGAAYAISPTLEKFVYAEQLSVPPTDHPLPLAAQIKAANATIGDGAAPSAVRPAPEPGDTTRVMYSDPNVGRERIPGDLRRSIHRRGGR
ncbi:PepSY-associated TM region [Brevibacterium iodinum ATCC 49514]|uniref:PepSY-associated TM region n=1 Tax=Brevibacterium iodinum ATCC 49514 TaxID=1255616 RepID=A0A2H1J601_9MICO|nr:PepSY-associated TM region [Brevibacterium iodinum ATCC 49514]SUW14272.1 Uncharacterized iron-regulated membrane protein [Brevibacterium iodinum]